MPILMTMPLALLLASIAQPIPEQGPDPRHSDQMRAFEARRQGRLLPLPEIEARVVPTMRGARYLGFDFDPESGIYTLKFLRNGAVIWIEVDGHSGQILGRTGR